MTGSRIAATFRVRCLLNLLWVVCCLGVFPALLLGQTPATTAGRFTVPMLLASADRTGMEVPSQSKPGRAGMTSTAVGGPAESLILEPPPQSDASASGLHRLVPDIPAAAVESPMRPAEGPGQPVRTISPGMAALRSLIVPGWGQRSLGSKSGFRVFFGVEVVLWATYAGFRATANWKEQSYRLFALEHAAINPAGKDKQFYINIENYDSIDEYNQAKLRERNLRDYYRDRETYFWRWDASENRRKYERMRVTSDRYRNRAELTIGAVFANHLISALHAMWRARRAQGSEERLGGILKDWDLRISPGGAISLALRF